MLSQQGIGELEFSGRPYDRVRWRRPEHRPRLEAPAATEAAAAAAAAPAAAAPPAAAPAAADTGSMLAQLTQLGELRASGVLTETEFEVQKVRNLND